MNSLPDLFVSKYNLCWSVYRNIYELVFDGTILMFPNLVHKMNPLLVVVFSSICGGDSSQTLMRFARRFFTYVVINQDFAIAE